MFEWATTTYLERERSEIDEPVTTDVHRLIRFPMSLHGKSGLMVLPVPLDGLEEFDPLVSAVPERFRMGSAGSSSQQAFQFGSWAGSSSWTRVSIV